MFKFILVIGVCFLGGSQACQATDFDFLQQILHAITGTCCPTIYRDTAAPSCATLAAQAVSVDANLYGPPGIHYVVMASDYYMARMSFALASTCPADQDNWNDMQLSTYWTALDSGDAWDCGFFKRVTRRECIFPTTPYPFLCRGKAGTPGTHGESLGWLSYIPVLTDNLNWCLFVHCWDPNRPGHTGTNYARSWNVFSRKKTLTDAEKTLIINKVTALGFDPDKRFSTAFVNPSLNVIGAQ